MNRDLRLPGRTRSIKQRRLTAAERTAIRQHLTQLHASARTLAQLKTVLCEEYHLHPSTAYQWLRSWGLRGQ